MRNPESLRRGSLAALLATDPDEKTRAVFALTEDADTDRMEAIPPPDAIPGRPDHPVLVAPAQVRQRSAHTPDGRAALIHSLAHIEFNAINLALDIMWRFPGLPAVFYQDWRRVAQEEAVHFSLLADHLRGMGSAYGAMPAHDGLWEMAARTSRDLLARLALVPRTLEARGLDVSPQIRNKLAGAGDKKGADILDRILADEIGHVAIGNRWYRWECERLGVDPVAQYDVLAARYRAPWPRGPFNVQARLAAGFTEREIEALRGLPPSPG
ncbi:MAG: ferritin-like domain-containing protein [Candidimonas sp.]